MSETRHSQSEQPIEPDPTHLTRWCTDHNFNPFADDGDWLSDSYHDVSCFVTDLFDRRDFDYPSAADDCALVLSSDPIAAESNTAAAAAAACDDDDDDDLESNFDSRLGFEAAESNSQASGSEFDVFLAPPGLRIAGLESDSDSENDDDSNRVSEGIQSIWDSIFMEERPIDAYDNSDNSDWEDDDVVTALPQPEEVSVTSGFTSEEEDVPDGALSTIEWEILLTVNNFRRNVDDVELDIETAEYIEAIFDQFVKNASACKGSPPAALRVVEDLPILTFAESELNDEVVCAVCKDEIVSDDKVRSLPCCHYYHHDCIVPWLSMRNTCPVCRYELPTDDVEYEMSKRERANRGLSWGSQVRVDY